MGIIRTTAVPDVCCRGYHSGTSSLLGTGCRRRKYVRKLPTSWKCRGNLRAFIGGPALIADRVCIGPVQRPRSPRVACTEMLRHNHTYNTPLDTSPRPFRRRIMTSKVLVIIIGYGPPDVTAGIARVLRV